MTEGKPSAARQPMTTPQAGDRRHAGCRAGSGAHGLLPALRSPRDGLPITSQLLWRTEGGKRLVADTPCLRLVVEAAGGRATFRLLDRPEHAGMREPVGFASGVAADIRAAMGAAERMREWFELPADAIPRA